MQVRIIDTYNQQDVDKFVKLPFHLYAGSKQWVPPLLSSARKILNRDKHPFYEHSEAAFLLAERDGKVLGRLAVMDNVNYQAYRNVKAGFFGFFESVEQQEVAEGLFSMAFDWARGRGLESMMGLKNRAIETLLQARDVPAFLQGIEYSLAIADQKMVAKFSV